MLKVVFGDEPYHIGRLKQEFLANREGMDVGYFQDLTSEAQLFMTTPSLLGGVKAAVFEVDELSSMEHPFLNSFIKGDSFCDVLILPRKADKNKRFYKKLEKEGCIQLCNKELDEKKIERFLLSYVTRKGAQITGNAYREFLSRLDYFENKDINLSLVLKELDKLVQFSKAITEEQVRLLTPDYRQGNVFLFEKLLKENEAEEICRQLSLLSEEEQIGLLYLLLRSFRIAWKQKQGFSKDEIGARFLCFQKKSEAYLLEAIRLLTDTVTGIKKGRVAKKSAAKLVLMQIMALRL